MQKLSVVIICKNEAHVIGITLAGFTGLTDDIVVYDNGSTDGSQEIARQGGARLFEGSWESYGKTKNKANSLAKYDWILSLDADETVDEELKKNLLQLKLDDEKIIYEFRFKNFLGNQWIRFGEWGLEKHKRLFNRRVVQWNEAEVHETLVLPPESKSIRLRGYVLHRTIESFEDYEKKMRNYADLNAVKYFRQSRKAGGIRLVLSPVFSFLKNYVFLLGFLDGRAGFHCARIKAHYIFLKYKGLKDLKQNSVNAT